MTMHRTITFTPIPSGASSTASRDMRISLPREPWHVEPTLAEPVKQREPQYVTVIAPRIGKPRMSRDTYGDTFGNLDEDWLRQQLMVTPKPSPTRDRHEEQMADRLAAHLRNHEDTRDGMAATFRVTIKTIDRALSVLRSRGVLAKRSDPSTHFAIYRVIQ